MKRVILVTLAIVLGLASLGTGFSIISLAQKAHRHAFTTTQAPKQQPVASNATSSVVVPDVIAYEILLRRLSTGDEGEDKDGKIRESYLRWAGFDEVQKSGLKFAAAQFKQQINLLDAQAAKIKDANWPQPNAETIAQLAQLQSEKESLVLGIRDALLSQLAAYHPEAITAHLARIKTSTKAYTPDLSSAPEPKKISLLSSVLHRAFVVEAAAKQTGSCSGSIYICSTSWPDTTVGSVYACGTLSSDYNSCGHSYDLHTYLNHSGYNGNVQGSGVNYATIAIDPNPASEYVPMSDGSFTASSQASVRCTHNNWTYTIGGSGSQTSIPKSVKIVKVLAQPDEPEANAGVTVGVSAKGSENCTSDCNPVVTWGLEYNVGGVVFDNNPLPHDATISLDSVTHAGNGSHTVNARTNNARRGPVQFTAKIKSAPDGVTYETTEVKSNEACWGKKVSGSCPFTP